MFVDEKELIKEIVKATSKCTRRIFNKLVNLEDINTKNIMFNFLS